ELDVLGMLAGMLLRQFEEQSLLEPFGIGAAGPEPGTTPAEAQGMHDAPQGAAAAWVAREPAQHGAEPRQRPAAADLFVLRRWAFELRFELGAQGGIEAGRPAGTGLVRQSGRPQELVALDPGGDRFPMAAEAAGDFQGGEPLGAPEDHERAER